MNVSRPLFWASAFRWCSLNFSSYPRFQISQEDPQKAVPSGWLPTIDVEMRRPTFSLRDVLLL